MIDFNKILKENLYGVFATSEEGKPKTRVFQYLFSDENKIYFGTTKDKSVYRQIIKNPNVSFCTHKQDFSFVLSVNGKAVFVSDMGLKKRAMDEYPAIKALYKSPDNPVFQIFYLDVEEVDTFSFAQGAVKETI